MNRSSRAVTLHDVVMGKKGIRYTLTEMVTILTHYNVAPTLQRSHGRKLILFKQLHRLDHDKGGLTRYDRRLILSGLMPPAEGSPGACSIEPDDIEESKVEEVAELLTPFIKPERSRLSAITTCIVCFERHSRRHFPNWRITSECIHEPDICLDCLQQAIDSQIESRSWNTLTCPLCPMKLSFEAVKALSSPETFERYDRHATMHALRTVPKFCMCLSPGCDSGQVHTSGDRQPIMTCNVCRFKTCFTHQMPWHRGMTCTEYDQTRQRQNEENAASEALLQTVGMICPSCSIPGIKVSGCDHMTCPQCSYEYCSRCMASYKMIQNEGNTAHQPNCPYHTNRLPADAMTLPGAYLDENGNVLPWPNELEGRRGGEAENVAPVIQRLQPAVLPRRPRPRANHRQQAPPLGDMIRIPQHELSPDEMRDWMEQNGLRSSRRGRA